MSRRLLGLLLGLAALFVGLGVPAAASASSGSEPDAVALLERALRAQDALAYSGVQQVWDRSGSMRTVGISHQPGSGTLLEVEDAADGGQAAGFVIGAEQPAISPAAILGLLASSYRLAVTGTEPVAGRSAVVIGATDDEGRPMARFWVDAATGLLLRREVFDANGQLQRSSGFEHVAMTVGRVQHLPPLLPAAHGPGLQQVDLAAWCRRGWTCLDSIGRLQLVDARPVEDAGSSTLHLTYSDGLNVVSVFEELGRLPSRPLAGSAAAVVDDQPVRVFTGSPERVVWSGAGQVFTVVTDAPSEVVEAVVAALPHSTSAGTVWSRLHRGGARVVSWLNPFS